MEGGRGGDGFDAVVVGSGYGGGVAACRLAAAGANVCLVERGRRWEGKDFPTTCWQMVSSAVRLDWRKWGVDFGPKDALFQVHIQGDSLATVACGLGGGSLVNAGLIAATPASARKNSRWPKEWEKNWEACEAAATEMLRPQTTPSKFPSAKVMDEIAGEIEESTPSKVKMTINFDGKESCLACGNCLSGCPYNAKNSVDKTYLAWAIQFGCVVKTECRVKFIVREEEEDFEGLERIDRRKSRRWRVHFNEFDYIGADFVVLSAGVLGTTEILFQSQRRGLRLSERLGFGLSCNGNNVGCVAGSRAPLHARGLTKKQFFEVPLEDRPGPAICSSYTSSLGFTIQNGVIPAAYPELLFKGIFTYGWPSGYWFLHGLAEKLKHLIGLQSTQTMILNMMGHDDSDGQITLDERSEKISFTPPRDGLLPRKLQTIQRLTKRIGGIFFMSRFRSTSVHLLGGCNAASDPSNGVCNPDGQVFQPSGSSFSVHPGLYVSDASLIPCSVSINPCLTITTASEHVGRHLVQEVLKYKSLDMQLPLPALMPPAGKRSSEVDGAADFNARLKHGARKRLEVKEIMRGQVGGMPCEAHLVMRMNLMAHKNKDTSLASILKGKVGGYVVCKSVDKDKLYIIDGAVDMCSTDRRTPYTQYMRYHLLLASSSGSRYVLEGKKVMNPFLLFLYAWKESRTVEIQLKSIHTGTGSPRQSPQLINEAIELRGELYIPVFELLRSLITLSGERKSMFVFTLLQSIFTTYILQTPRSVNAEFGPKDMMNALYPCSILHELKTDDGVTISCRQWKSDQNSRRFEGKQRPYPVLLLNGHSAESYFLPTEPTDLVRTLIGEGYEIWLLQTRVHPLHPSNEFTIEDIGKFDIPAVVAKMQEDHGPSLKYHVVAHCIGGLSTHIALMGGHISPTQISSLTCTNSSMFFKLTAFAMVKLRLPLLPISMLILGKNKIISMLENSNDSVRHQLLKLIVRLIPRYERCTCNECELFSGIFGNAFWHDNISDKMHYFQKENVPRLPLAAFPHLRKIGLSGFIVDSEGRNKYLIHPERMAVHTLYISGGRTLLVTPETSQLANQYMKLHQPGFHHKRVVVEGFGHSDLLIGQESHKKVFPYILSHMEISQQGKLDQEAAGCKSCSKESLSWSDSGREHGGFGAFYGLLLFLLLIWFMYLILGFE